MFLIVLKELFFTCFYKKIMLYLKFRVVARQLIFLSCLPLFFYWCSLNKLLEIIIHRIICESLFHSNFFNPPLLSNFEVGFLFSFINRALVKPYQIKHLLTHFLFFRGVRDVLRSYSLIFYWFWCSWCASQLS